MFCLTARAQVSPTVADANLEVHAVVTGLTQPTTMAFLPVNSRGNGDGNGNRSESIDLLVLEKTTGKVQRVTDGVLKGTVLDLAVNFFSERGLLGIALHPKFSKNGWVYLYWTESSTGADTNVAASVALLGNRVDRFVWNGSTLQFDRNLIRLHAFQADANQPLRGNHNGGILVFGPRSERSDDSEVEDTNEASADDGGKEKLFVVIGDNGRRGQLQNLVNGPFGAGVPDDQFGGPQPDAEHLTGVVLRLNDDGTTPIDNPFYTADAAIGGSVGASIQKIYAYGRRNSFGMTVDPVTGRLWESENGDDSFDEINQISAGDNGGWVQIMGPVARIAQFKAIETSPQFFGLQQVRWPPTLLADTPQEALSRLFMLPGARYTDPQFSWKYAVPPAGIGFLSSDNFGKAYRGNLFVGAATPNTQGGYLFRFTLTPNRKSLAFSDPLLQDRVADNAAKHDITESQSLLFGINFGVGTDVREGPNGNLFVVSASKGAIFEIRPK